MNIHRVVGYAYLAVYIALMVQMVPRMWQYQVEFPPRTVAHIMLGMTIGVLLIIKLSILRWFRHFEEWMPFLGVAMLICSVLLLGLSLPFVFKEHQSALSGEAFSQNNRARVRTLLQEGGLAQGDELEKLVSMDGLQAGRAVLLSKCTYCHDLKTAIARPRTPEDWVATVERMAEKPSLGPVISPEDGLRVTAYLVAITPEIRDSMKKKREEAEGLTASMGALHEMEPSAEPATAVPSPPVATPPEPTPAASSLDSKPEPPSNPSPVAKATPPKPVFDLNKAKIAFQKACSKCHPASDIDDAPPKSSKEISALLARMIENGMEIKKAELELIRRYMIATYLN